jgi:hypothetical protein
MGSSALRFGGGRRYCRAGRSGPFRPCHRKRSTRLRRPESRRFGRCLKRRSSRPRHSRRHVLAHGDDPGRTVITGALIKIPTLLIVQGDATVYIGDEPMVLSGYNVVPAAAGRKQAFVAQRIRWLTMIFPSDVKDVGLAEEQFTDENHLLASHRDTGINNITITGE